MQDCLNEDTNEINFQGRSQILYSQVTALLIIYIISVPYIWCVYIAHMCVVGVHDALHMWLCVNVYVSVCVCKYKLKKPHPVFMRG